MLRFKDDNGYSFPSQKKVKYNQFLKIPSKNKPDYIDSKKLISVLLHRKGAKFSDNTDSLSIGSTTYYKRKSGQFIYGKQNFFNGAFDILNDNLDGGLSSGDVPCLDIDNAIIDSSFFLNYIGRESYYKSIEKYTSGTGSKRLHEEQLLGLEIKLPVFREQEKIGGFLSAFDKLIQKQQEKIGLLKDLKKGYLQKMFPKKGANFPEIRFKSFIDVWEQCKLGDYSEIIAGGTPSTMSKDYWIPKEIPWISSGEVHKKRIFFTDNMISQKGFDNSSARWVKENSVLIALAGQGKTRGTVAINSIALTTNQSIAAIMIKNNLHHEFLFQNLEFRYDELRTLSSSDGSRGGLNKQILSRLEIPTPKLEEQRKIGLFLKSIDDLITLHQRKLERLEELKKGFMQRLFA